MKKTLLGIFLLLISACGEDPAWTDARIQSAVASCKAEILAPPPRATEEEAQSYCSCYYEKIRAEWNYQQYTSDKDRIDQQMENSGRADSCGVAP